MKPTRCKKTHYLLSVVAVLAMLGGRASAQEGTLAYRGFTIDVSAANKFSNFADVETSLEHQIDIVADCGAKPEIIAFFQSQQITVVPELAAEQGGDPGRFAPGRGVLIAAITLEREPVLLHELLHAFQAQRLGDNNPELSAFYFRAKTNHLVNQNSPIMENPSEFFAIAGSLYLVGHLNQNPFSRVRLKQVPGYYAWLGELFGVQK